ncbi:hypothetical protein [Paraburkholderia sp. SIMBA_054]|jgi:hypothetical protein|uniref:hypothetical protein n=1 Tax=Paraburkholderia TaxID=1822464 RepID=UPI00397BB106
MPTFQKSDIARTQLETAVDIFFKGFSHHSVITLAGAASGILDGLLLAAGKEPFIDYARRVHAALQGQMPARVKFAHFIEKRLGVSSHKHLSETDDNSITLDLEDLAEKALTRAIVEYVTLYGQEEPFVKAYLQWSWVTKDGPGLLRKYTEVPPKMRLKSE